MLVELSGPVGPPAGAGARAVSRKGARARRVPPPPPEPVVVAGGGAPTAAQVAAAAQEAFAATYVMFRDARVHFQPPVLPAWVRGRCSRCVQVMRAASDGCRRAAFGVAQSVPWLVGPCPAARHIEFGDQREKRHCHGTA